jgi:hypothetical protein
MTYPRTELSVAGISVVVMDDAEELDRLVALQRSIAAIEAELAAGMGPLCGGPEVGVCGWGVGQR